MACFCIKYSFLVFCGHDFKIQRTGQIVLKQTLGSILSEIQYENRIFDTDKMRLPCDMILLHWWIKSITLDVTNILLY